MKPSHQPVGRRRPSRFLRWSVRRGPDLRSVSSGFRQLVGPLFIGRLLPLMAGVLLASPGASIVYLVPSDESMVARSPVIAFGRIGEAGVRAGGGGFETDYRFHISDLLKGAVPGSTVTVRRPGGMRADGLVAEIRGLPPLAEGDRVLLFLLQRGGQSLRSGAGSPNVPGLPAELTGLMPAAEFSDRPNSVPPRGRRNPRRRQPA